MKKICFLLFLLVFTGVHSQIVTIPDTNFKNALLNDPVADTDGNGTFEDVDTNNDGEIQVWEALAVTNLQLMSYQIDSLVGIESFTNLVKLFTMNNNLTTVDLSQNIALEELWIYNNILTSLDVSALTNLEWLVCTNNQLSSLDVSENLLLKILWTTSNNLTSLDVSQNLDLVQFWCSGNEISTLDISANSKITSFTCENNELTSLNIQNGNNMNMVKMWALNNPDLPCILVDDENASYPECSIINNNGWCKDVTSIYSEDISLCDLSLTENNKLEVIVYPNPTSELVFISSEKDIKNIIIYALDGRVMMNVSSGTIDVNTLPSGIYFMEFHSNDQKSVQKLIKV